MVGASLSQQFFLLNFLPSSAFDHSLEVQQPRNTGYQQQEIYDIHGHTNNAYIFQDEIQNVTKIDRSKIGDEGECNLGFAG